MGTWVAGGGGGLVRSPSISHRDKAVVLGVSPRASPPLSVGTPKREVTEERPLLCR